MFLNQAELPVKNVVWPQNHPMSWLELLLWSMIVFAVFLIAAPVNAKQALPIPQLTAEKLDLNYWQSQHKQPRQLLLAAKSQQQWQQQLRLASLIQEPEQLPIQYSDLAVRAIIETASAIPKAPRFFADGRPVSAKDYHDWQQQMALETLPQQTSARWGLVTKRTDIRRFPTQTPLLSADLNADLDRLQETAVFVGQWLQILHLSRDQQWAFVITDHYRGWLQTQDIALSDRATVLQFLQRTPRLFVTGRTASTNVTPEQPQASAVQLEMGVQLPLLPQPDVLVNGQHPAFSHVIQLPTRQPDGQLKLMLALVARHQPVHIGPLAYNSENLLQQAFQLLGERYGWGHAYETRDCSGFIRDILQTFALNVPRNTSEQAAMPAPQSLDLTPFNESEKQQWLAQLQLGDLVFIPGHVMMVLAVVDQEVWVIHDANGLTLRTADGTLQSSQLNGVAITPLSALWLPAPEAKSFISAITKIQRLRDLAFVAP